LALSGGGFRASLSALGAVRLLAGSGLLAQVKWASSVSGGSIANGLLAHHYEELEKEGFALEALDRVVLTPFIRRVTSSSLTRTLLANLWRVVGPGTRTDLLARELDRWFFGGRRLEDLPQSCRFVFNAANLTTGVRFGFERDVVGDWVMGTVPTEGSGLRLAQAVAASSAVPGAFAPFRVPGLAFPCAEGRIPSLLDGGAYDNSALEVVDDLPSAVLVALNAGGLFHTGRYGWIPIIRDLERSTSLLYRQSTSLRYRDMVDRFKAWEAARRAGQAPAPWARRGVLFGLATSFKVSEEWAATRPAFEDLVPTLAGYKTSLGRVPSDICEQLVYRGWWLAGATLATYQRDVLPGRLPEWEELP